MAHHKRRRPKHQRAGCLTCKAHKDERACWKPRSKRERGELGLGPDGDVLKYAGGATHEQRRLW